MRRVPCAVCVDVKVSSNYLQQEILYRNPPPVLARLSVLPAGRVQNYAKCHVCPVQAPVAVTNGSLALLSSLSGLGQLRGEAGGGGGARVRGEGAGGQLQSGVRHRDL